MGVVVNGGLLEPVAKKVQRHLLGTLRPTRAVGPRWCNPSTPPKLTWADDPHKPQRQLEKANATVIKSAGQALRGCRPGKKEKQSSKETMCT